MKKLLLIFFLILPYLTQCDVWEKIERTESIKPQYYLGYDFSSSAKMINYTITCSLECDVYLMNMNEFERFRDKLSFKYLRYHERVLKVSGEWSTLEDLKLTLFVVVVNRAISNSLFAHYELYQFVPPGNDWTVWLAVFIPVGVAVIGIGVLFGVVIFLFCSMGVTCKDVLEGIFCLECEEGKSDGWKVGRVRYRPGRIRRVRVGGRFKGRR